MRYSITVSDMTDAEMRAVTAALNALGAEPLPAAQRPGSIAAVAEALVQHQVAGHGGGGGGVSAPPVAPAAPTITAPLAPPPGAPVPPPPPPSGVVPPAPSTAAITGNTAVSWAELDSRGVPWNAEYHASTKGKTKDGAWMRKKKTDANVVQAWESQFIGRPAPAAPAAPTVTAPPAPPPPPQAAIPNGMPPAPPSASATNGMPPAPPVAATEPPAPSAAELNQQHAPHVPNNGLNGAPAPLIAAPAADGVPIDYHTFFKTWTDMAASGQVNQDHANWIMDQLDIADQSELSVIFTHDERRRAICYGWFLQLQAGQTMTAVK